MIDINIIYNENCLTGLSKLPDNSIDCCVTSPPYYGLRDYGTEEQIGLEETPELFISSLVQVFEQVRRVLKPKGTLWLNLGDSYAANIRQYGSKNAGNLTNNSKGVLTDFKKKRPHGYKEKDLFGIPWMVAFALRSAGWYLRQDIIWNKPNPMPESVTDRCTKAHEYIFLMSKSKKYYFNSDSIKTPMKDVRPNGIVRDRLLDYDSKEKQLRQNVLRGGYSSEKDIPEPNKMANKRSVWTVTTKPFKEAHFATFPEDLIVDCIKAGCPEGGIVLDPFMGAGTTAVVAKKLNRNYIGFELNPEYMEIANRRINGPVEPEYIPEDTQPDEQPRFVQYDLFGKPVRF